MDIISWFPYVILAVAILMGILLICFIISIIKSLVKKKDEEDDIVKVSIVNQESLKPEVVYVEKPVEKIVEKIVEKPVYIEKPIEKVVEKVEAPAPVTVEAKPETAQEIVIADVSNKTPVKRVPFYEKLLFADKQTQVIYDALNNAFLEYRKAHSRVSAKCTTIRFGRELIAKITYRGKTLKLHLALKVNKFDEKRYFQKDLSDTKAYKEVPFTVKVKSGRALNRALELIEALANKQKMEKKKRCEPVDSIELLKAKIKA